MEKRCIHCQEIHHTSAWKKVSCDKPECQEKETARRAIVKQKCQAAADARRNEARSENREYKKRQKRNPQPKNTKDQRYCKKCGKPLTVNYFWCDPCLKHMPEDMGITEYL